jgi:hypothetical protein
MADRGILDIAVVTDVAGLLPNRLHEEWAIS